MINTEALRDILKTIYGIDDKYLIELSRSWFVPTIDRDELIGTWIGYRVLSKEPYTRMILHQQQASVPMRISFRLAFVGEQAEDFAEQTMMWDERDDVRRAFEKYEAQLNYTDRSIFTYPIRNEGYNDRPAWIVDMTAQTFYVADIQRWPWFRPKVGG